MKKENSERIAFLKEEQRKLLEKAKSETRSLTEEEKAQFDTYQKEKDGLVIEESLRSLESSKTPRSVTRAEAFAGSLNDIRNNRSLDSYVGVTRNEITVQMRADDKVITDTGAAEAMIPVTIGDVIKPLEKGLVINQLGIKMQYGLVGQLIFPTLAAVEATIENENANVGLTKLDIGKIRPNPWRVAISIPLSNEAIDETSDQIFNTAVEQMSLGVARVLNRVMFSSSKIGLASPGVFVKETPNVEYDNKPLFADVVMLETEVMDAGVDTADGTAAYIVSPKMYGYLKTTPIESGTPKMILENGMMNGYPVKMTGYMGVDTIGFGVFSNCGVGQWGKVRMVVDEKSLAGSNETKLTLNSKYDIIIARPEAFAIATKKTAKAAPLKA